LITSAQDTLVLYFVQCYCNQTW